MNNLLLHCLTRGLKLLILPATGDRLLIFADPTLLHPALACFPAYIFHRQCVVDFVCHDIDFVVTQRNYFN